MRRCDADPRDTVAIRDAITCLLDSPSEREELGRRARERASEFSWDKTAERALASPLRRLGQDAVVEIGQSLGCGFRRVAADTIRWMLDPRVGRVGLAVLRRGRVRGPSSRPAKK